MVMFLAPVLGGQAVSLKVKILNGLKHIYILKKLGKKILSKKTIVKVRGGGPYFCAFLFWTLPLRKYIVLFFIKQGKYYVEYFFLKLIKNELFKDLRSNQSS